MKQLIQHLRTGVTALENVPDPQVRPGYILIQTHRSLVSLGTERMLVAFGKSNFVGKIRQQPERVKQVLTKIKADGLRSTLETIVRKLDQPIPLGYCHVGTILAIGEGVTEFRIGDRVASNGPHAEIVCVARNLVVPIPDNVSDDHAAFTVVGAIGLQGIRLLNPTLNETVVVIGLGLIGLLTAQLLRLNGCRVIGIELDQAKCLLAEQQGFTVLNPLTGTNPSQAVLALTNGIGADGVIITASAKTNDIISQAAQMSRQRGRIVLIGSVGLSLDRADFYEKELTFQVSCSYGPGRYDPAYEQQGRDYPLAYVRWTENRNFQTILQFLSTKQLDVEPLITDRVLLADCATIYNTIQSSHRIASLLIYPETVSRCPIVQHKSSTYQPGKEVIGMIGAGNFSQTILLPALQSAKATIKTIASAGGLTASLLANKYSIPQRTADYKLILQDVDINLCIITTKHDSHARLTIEALLAGKHVFVEKPLAIYAHELQPIIDAQNVSGRTVMVGFNRRFSPFAQKMKALLGSDPLPMNVVITINAGAIPADSWIQDRAIGGGRIVGEGCHFIDLITFLTGSQVQSVCMNVMGQQPNEMGDSVSLLLRYHNGSMGVINFFSNGHKAYSKERIEVYSQGRTLVIDNFRRLQGYGFNRFSNLSGRQNKGHRELVKQLIEQVRSGGAPLIPFDELINTTQATFAALQSWREHRWVDVAGVGLTESLPAEVL
ncbi:bi-domain-containing oxidoreductase [Spirosoma harenae]